MGKFPFSTYSLLSKSPAKPGKYSRVPNRNCGGRTSIQHPGTICSLIQIGNNFTARRDPYRIQYRSRVA